MVRRFGGLGLNLVGALLDQEWLGGLGWLWVVVCSSCGLLVVGSSLLWVFLDLGFLVVVDLLWGSCGFRCSGAGSPIVGCSLLWVFLDLGFWWWWICYRVVVGSVGSGSGGFTVMVVCCKIFGFFFIFIFIKVLLL